MTGDRYSVFYQTRDAPADTVPAGVHDRWGPARTERDNIFEGNKDVTRAWIMRSNPGLDLRHEKRGFTLERYFYSSRQRVS